MHIHNIHNIHTDQSAFELAQASMGRFHPRRRRLRVWNGVPLLSSRPFIELAALLNSRHRFVTLVKKCLLTIIAGHCTGVRAI